ncbi:MAG: BatD family protein [Paludibacteraceae bacterium]|nr:BatD family protein [Paludibacteraceae bacterium]
MKKLYYLIFLLFATFANASASIVKVSATMDSTTLLIGEQRVLRLEAQYPSMVEMTFPELKTDEKLGQGLEILRKNEKDTVELKGSVYKVSQEYIVTAFDTGRYEIPAIKFTTNDRHYMTDRIIVDVVTIEEDFAQTSIKSNEDLFRPSFNFKRLFQYFSILLIVGGIAMIVILSIILFRKEKEGDLEFDNTDKRSPREVALTSLNDIKEEKIWTQGEQKKYHTQITDTLRRYFVEKFNVSAMEMTSDEIIDEMQSHEETAIVEDKIRQVFKLSDMVKFAKYEASNEENEMSIVNALFIVQQTSQLEEVAETSENKPETGSEVIENEEFKL